MVGRVLGQGHARPANVGELEAVIQMDQRDEGPGHDDPHRQDPQDHIGRPPR